MRARTCAQALNSAARGGCQGRRRITSQTKAMYQDSEYSVGALLECEVIQETQQGFWLAMQGCPQGATGKLPYGEISWTRHKKLLVNCFELGAVVRVEVISAEPKKNSFGQKLTFSYRNTLPNPWRDVDALYPVGWRGRVPVSQFIGYGALVELPSGVNALVHNTEISWRERVVSATDVFQLGQEIEVVVLRSDAANSRLNVSHRMAVPSPWPELAATTRVGDVFEAVVVTVVDYGVFVRLSNGFVGLLHVTRFQPGAQYARGDTVTVDIESVDAEAMRLAVRALARPN